MKLILTLLLASILTIAVYPIAPRLFSRSGGITGTQITISRKPTQEEIIANTQHPKEIMVIWALESSLGKNDGCRNSGKYNGFGFRQNKNEWVCYNSFQEVVNEVDKWLTNKDMVNYCLYNKGIATTDCSYAYKAMELLK